MNFKGAHILHTDQFTRKDLEKVMEVAERMLPIAKREKTSELLKDYILAALFFEPSTRTRLSFECSMLRLGGKVINTTEVKFSSLIKGESLEDTAKVLSSYCDVIAVRHPELGSAAKMASYSDVPVLNGGDGPGQHPTQALLDLFTIHNEKGKVDGLHVALAGDLKNGRTVHSLAYLLSNFKVSFTFIAPEGLRMPGKIVDFLREKGFVVNITDDLASGAKDADVLYDTRIQKERFEDVALYEKYKSVYIIDPELISKCKKDITIMHPLPRVDEITTAVDKLPNAAYFRQAFYGVPVRMALLALVLGKA